MSLSDLSRHDVRYWCFRFKTEDAGGAKATGAPRGIRKYFEEHKYFTAWAAFGESMGWDVNAEDRLAIVPLRRGSADVWADEVEASATDLPGTSVGS